ncbi:MAG TPA: diaminopimelate epimerase [Firmicutes bacterium]|nr:diaminopimelate epimerase [Bacillota bacterium]
MRFVKMHGAGNDYVYVDGFQERLLPDPGKLAVRIADRHFGVGGDGLILILPPETPDGDVRMRMFNADGSESEMCGNGVRCVAKYAVDHGLVSSESPVVRVETLAGLKTIDVVRGADGKVEAARVDMGVPRLRRGEIPMSGPPHAPAVDVPLEVAGRSYRITALSMGNPHCVVFLPSVDDLRLDEIGPAFEHHPAFPRRVNAEFCRVMDRETLQMRVWERGTGETLACGTGASAAAVAAHLNGLTGRRVTIHVRGGTLSLEWGADDHVYLTGPAVEVFSGEWPDEPGPATIEGGPVR